ncbi:unnamed protein product [Rhizoctonia solani]|uniref:T6SS Phospholipase effector Tle1-like catalytic domain-containing protein n=1 Tax=Rhizoctonia solani TaxID=456999 RepID=A0A8H2ZXU1_9AGAM|nr:unnamed protein product [Rhizoctonia solani]
MNRPAVDQLQDMGLKPKPRKLIVCIDGTSNQFSEKNTHVVELYSRIKKDETQLTYYNSGIGTYARPFWWSFAYQKQQMLNQIDLAIAWQVIQSTGQGSQRLTQFDRNFEKVVLGAYRWLADTYEPGDQIFLFGFSRGAYQVRTLAAMIQRVGLIYPGNQEQIPFAWSIYSNEDTSAEKFKEAFCRQKVNLHFVGVWDTVASVGILPRKPFPLTDKCEHIKHFRHALALDELRVKFLPEHINDDAWDERTLKEVWFAGTHSDIGGGNKANPTLDRGGEPLKWMMEEAHDQGLSVRLHDVKIGMPHAEVTNSMRWKWLILEILPVSWKKYRPNGDSTISRWFHLMTPREVLPRHSIHWTVGASLEQGNRDSGNLQKPYGPKAIPMDEAGKEVNWNSMKLNHHKNGIPKWADNHNFTRMIEILKNEPESVDNKWFSDLQRYVLRNTQGRPETIWAYGGPQFLQRLFRNYPTKPETVQIVRSIIGFDPKIPWNMTATAPKSGVQITTNNEGKESAERLRNMVIPRICLLLTQWTTDSPRSEPEPPEPTRWAWILELLGFRSTNTSNPNSVDAKWDLVWFPKEHRSTLLARAIVDLISDVAKTKYIEVLEEASAKLATVIGEVMNHLTIADRLIETAAVWGTEEAALSESVMNTIGALFKHDASKEIFYIEGIGSKLGPLIRAKDVYPKLALQAMRTAAQLSRDHLCGMDIADSRVIRNVLDVLRGDYEIREIEMKQLLGDEACITLGVLSEHTDCGMELSDDYAFSTLFEILEGEKYVDGILHVLKNLAPHFSDRFLPSQVGIFAKLMSQNADATSILADIADQPLGNFDVGYFKVYKEEGVNFNQWRPVLNLVFGAYTYLSTEASLEKLVAESAERYVVLSEVSQSLFLSLRVQFRSQESINELLAMAVRIALQESISDDQFLILSSLAVAGNKVAVPPVLAASVNTEIRRESIEHYIPVLVDLIASENEQSLKDSLEVLTALVKKGYLIPSPHIKRLLDAVAGIVLSVYAGAFRDPGKLNWWDQDAIVIAAFRSVEALCVDPTARIYMATTGLLEAVILETNKHVNVSESEKAMLDHLEQYDELRAKIEFLSLEKSQRKTELELETPTPDQDSCEELPMWQAESDETSPLISRD